MIAFEYLYRGLCGLARAHHANAMAGHLGAAVTAGYFFGEENSDLDDVVFRAVEQQLDKIVEGDEAIWFDQQEAGITVQGLFKLFPAAPARETRISSVAHALAKNIDKLRQSGHNVIFASIALRALHDHPEHATPAIVTGIVRLINQFDNAPPGRGYFGASRGWISGDQVELPPSDVPIYANQQDMIETVIDELIQSASVRRRGFGGLFHLINHANAIVELGRFGYHTLANRAFAAHHRHLRLLRVLPDVENELGPLKAASHDPSTADYWNEERESQWSAQLTHRVKTMYGFYSILRAIENEQKREEALAAFRYLMA